MHNSIKEKNDRFHCNLKLGSLEDTVIEMKRQTMYQKKTFTKPRA